MSVVMRDYHGHRHVLTTLDEAGDWFDEQTASILPTGSSGQVIWYGPLDGGDELRLDIDVDTDRAALTWLADRTHAVELPPASTITVLVSADGDRETVAADRARVSVETARRAVLEYTATGRRPTTTTWEG